MKRTSRMFVIVVTLMMTINIFSSATLITNSFMNNCLYTDNTEVLEPPEQ